MTITSDNFRVFFEQSPEPTLILENGLFTDCNQAAERMMRATHKTQLLSVTPASLSPERQPDGRLSSEMAEEMIGIAIEKGSHRFEWIHRRLDGENFPVELTLTAIKLGDRQVIHTIWRDISARKQAEEELKQSANFTRALLDATPTPVFYKDSEGRYQGCNRAFTEVMGKTAEELRGKTVHQLWPSENAEVYHQKDLELIHNPQHQVYEATTKDKDGNIRPVIFAKDVFYDEGGNVAGLVGAFLDISERKQAEEELLRLQSAVEQTGDGIALADLNGNVTYANQAWAKMHGYSVNEILGKHLSIFHTPEQVEKEVVPFNEKAEVTGGNTGEVGHARKDGTTFPTLMTVAVQKNKKDEPVGLIGIIRDITENKRVEQELKENQKFLTLVLDTMPGFLFWKDRNSIYLGSNKVFAKGAGLNESSEIVGKSDHELAWTKEEADAYIKDDRDVMESDTPKYHIIEPQLQASGKQTWVDTTKIPLHDAQGNVIGILGTFEDITERKQAEEERSRLAQLVQSSSEFINMSTLEGKMIFLSDAGCKMVGIDLQELDQHVIFEVLTEESLAKVQNQVLPILTEKGSWNGELRYRNLKTGRLIDCQASTFMIYKENGEPLYLANISRDITESKQAEELLHQSEANLSSALRVAQMGYWEFDIPTQMFTFNDQYYALLGIEAEKVGGYQMSAQVFAQQYVHPEDAALVGASIQKAMEATDPNFQLQSESRNLRGDGSIMWASVWFRIQKDAQGKTVKLYGVSQDINERKQAEAEIRRQSEKFQMVADFTYDWEYWLGTDNKYIYISPSVKRITGYEANDFMQKPGLFNEIVHPDNKQTFEEHVHIFHAEHSDAAGEVEVRILTQDGKERWLSHLCQPVYSASGQWLGRRGSNRDITENKKLEQEVQEAFERRGYQVQISTEISQELASASELSDLFERVVTLTKERLGYYHTQILRYDATQDAVVLINGYGKTGQTMLEGGHKMPLGSGLIGTAAENGETILRPTLAEDPDWQPNPLLPETKGEIAVPIKLSEQILGVLDVQSSQAGALSEDDRLLLEGLCGQIAVAIEQTRLRQEMTERLEEINRLYQNLSHEGWKTYRETADLPTGFVFDQTGIRPVEDELLADELFSNIPMKVLGGEVVGTLTVANDPRHPTSPEDYAFFQQVSDQIALALEGARLSAQTQSALAQTEKLSDAGLRFARAANLQELAKIAVETLGIPQINRAVLETFNYNSANELDSIDVAATWWSGTGHEPTAIGTRYTAEILPIMQLFVTPVSLFLNDAFNDKRVDNVTLEIVKQLNIHAIAVLPLYLGTRQTGVLLLESEEVYNFKEDETRLFSAMGSQIATVLENRRQFERAQQQAEREGMLNVISQKIQSATTVEAVLQIAARELGHALGAPMTIAQLSMKDKK